MKSVFCFVSLLVIILLKTVSVYSQVNLDSGLVASYQFEGNANDISGNGFDATVVGNPSFDQYLKIGDTTTDYLILPNEAITNILDFSVSFNVWFSQLTQEHSHQILNALCPSFIQHLGISYQNKHGWATEVGGVSDSWKQKLTIKTWYHVVMIRKGKNVSLYIDGVSLGKKQCFSQFLCSQTFLVGQYQDCGFLCIQADNSLQGRLDNLRIYNRALSPDEIATLNTMKSGNETQDESQTSFEVYPNPFSSSTSISFMLDEDSRTVIDLFDVQGLKIKSLVDENLTSGIHQVTFSRDQLAGGVYFLRMKMNDEVTVKKIVLE